MVFDVIVVGAGSAGCVLAARISAGGASVCLIEAGPADTSPHIHLPAGFPYVAVDPRLNWDYETAPEPALAGRRIGWPRGKVVGGSGSINGLVFLRGAHFDFDEWERLGASGWGFASVLPYFKRLERARAGSDEWRGRTGPVSVEPVQRPSAPARAFAESCRQLGYALNPDPNGASIDGVSFTDLNVRNGWRHSTAAAYLRPCLRRPNLHVLRRSCVRRVLLEDGRAIGVELERGGERLRIGARAEIVLAAGAIGSPLLLQMSGVGAGAQLHPLGVPVVHDLPGVGENLQDHFLVSFKFRTEARGTLNRVTRNPVTFARAAAAWLTRGVGQLAVGGTEAVLFARSDPAQPTPDIQFQCANFSVDRFETGLHPWPGFMACFYVCRPRSRGSVMLRDAAGRSPPHIQANYLCDPDDERVTRAGFAIANRIFDAPPMRSLIRTRLSPAGDCLTQAAMAEHIRREGTTGNHPCGTARMGQDAGAVVDPELRVHGLRGLRVIDASVMPTIPSSNIHAATIMIAEKGADLLAQSLRH